MPVQAQGTRSLLAAVTAFRLLRTPTKIGAELRSGGVSRLLDAYDVMPGEAREAVDHEASSLASRGVNATILGDDLYPDSFIHPESAPILFFTGNADLFRSARHGIGMCGSRAATEIGLQAAQACGEEVSENGLSVISGYAKGVDTQTHLAALRQQGSTVIVLAEGINHFRVKRTYPADMVTSGRTLVISQFAPAQPWTAGAAMTRNKIIFGLGRALVVVEAGDRGGTLAAGLGALKANQPVIVLDLGGETPAGNRILLDKGGIPVSSRKELAAALKALPGMLRVTTEQIAMFPQEN